MRIRLAIPDRHVTPDILEAALEATARANHAMISAGEIPGATEAISRGVRWRPEPYTDGEHFDLGDKVGRRGWGDCDDLAPWLAGELRATGQDPGATAVVRRSGPSRWHVVVRTSDGQVLDPSKWAGMKGKGSSAVVGAITRPMCLAGDGGMGVRRVPGGWAARCDLPWPDSDAHIASTSRARSPELALARAVVGAAYCGHGMEFPHTDLAQQIMGELVGEVGSLFGDIASAALPVAASFVPGGSAALPVASSLLSSLTHGGGPAGAGVPAGGGGAAAGMTSVPLPGGAGHIAYNPHSPGPIIVRF